MFSCIIVFFIISKYKCTLLALYIYVYIFSRNYINKEIIFPTARIIYNIMMKYL